MNWRLEPVAGTVPLPAGWAERGACRGYPTEWWYPGSGERGMGRTVREQKEDAAVALRICGELCPVRAECLVHALRHGEPGIWGGTEETERRHLSGRARRRAS